MKNNKLKQKIVLGLIISLVFGILGAVPEDGSTPELEAYGMDIKIKQIKEHRLVQALVKIAESVIVDN